MAVWQYEVVKTNELVENDKAVEEIKNRFEAERWRLGQTHMVCVKGNIVECQPVRVLRWIEPINKYLPFLKLGFLIMTGSDTPSHLREPSHAGTSVPHSFQDHCCTESNCRGSASVAGSCAIASNEVHMCLQNLPTRPPQPDKPGPSHRTPTASAATISPRCHPCQPQERTNVLRTRTRPLLRTGPPAEYTAFGPCYCVCASCHAWFWFEERLSTSTRRSGPLYHRCCMGGRVKLFVARDYPKYIHQLFSDGARNHSMSDAFGNLMMGY